MRKHTTGDGLLLCHSISPDRLGIAHNGLCFGDLRRPFDETKSDTPSSLGVATKEMRVGFNARTALDGQYYNHIVD